ncbi:MAG: hypothetical protein R6U11_03605 [Bacteroidales bacterium]
MKAAIIDCGTNTFHLLLADYDTYGEFNIVHKEMKDVKLGKKTIIKNEISPESMQRGINAFQQLLSSAKSFNPEKILATATSAVRSSSNGQVFVDEVFKLTGVKINVIDGDREASLIFKGVKLAAKSISKPVLIMDIGGGSTEFIIAANDEVVFKHSFDLGVARLLQKIKPSDPIKNNEIAEIHRFFDRELGLLKEQITKYQEIDLIGCSGSFESIHSIICKQFYNKSNNGDIVQINDADFNKVHELLKSASLICTISPLLLLLYNWLHIIECIDSKEPEHPIKSIA